MLCSIQEIKSKGDFDLIFIEISSLVFPSWIPWSMKLLYLAKWILPDRLYYALRDLNLWTVWCALGLNSDLMMTIEYLNFFFVNLSYKCKFEVFIAPLYRLWLWTDFWFWVWKDSCLKRNCSFQLSWRCRGEIFFCDVVVMFLKCDGKHGNATKSDIKTMSS